MTRAQYVMMCIIGGIAIAAFLQSYEVAKAMQRSGAVKLPWEWNA